MKSAEKNGNRKSVKHREQGLTLIELMVAMLIGLFLTIGSITVFVQSRGSYSVSNSVARLQENSRFALDVIAPDIRLARFWGRNNSPNTITVPAGIVVTCGTNGLNVTNWALVNNLTRDIRVVDDNYTAVDAGGNREVPCPPPWGDASARAQSDALVIRHASGQTTAPTNGRIQVRTDLATGIENGILFNNGVNPPTAGGPFAQTHDVVVNVYYVADRSDFDPNLPSLRMQTLDNNGVLQDRELITGVENMQVLLGVDLDGIDGVDQYVDDHGDIAPGGNVVAVRLWMLLRTNANENAFTDLGSTGDGRYTTPDPDGAADDIALGANYPAGFRRIQVSKTIMLRNNHPPSI